MQARFNELKASQLDHRNMVGLEYELFHYTIKPSFYVIRKQYRSSPEKAEIMALYYIIEGTVYQAPDLHTLLSNRVLTSLHFVTKAFGELHGEARFHPARGYIWKFEEEYESAKRIEMLGKIARQDGALSKSGGDGEGDDMMVTENEDLVTSPVDMEDDDSDDQDLFMVKSMEQAYETHVFSATIDGLIMKSAEFSSELRISAVNVDTTMDTAKELIGAPTSKGTTLKSLDMDALPPKTKSARKDSREDLASPLPSPASISGKTKRKRKIAADGLEVKRRKSRMSTSE